MKRTDFVVLLACVALIFACAGDKNDYVLTGIVPAGIGNGEVVYMTDHNNGLIIDSAVVSKGTFVFKGMIDDPKIVSLSLRYNMQADMILDKGKLTIDLSDPFSGKGNRLTEQLNTFYLKCSEAIMQSKTSISAINESLTDIEKSQMGDVIFDNLFTAIDEITKSFLKEHPNDALGAMIFYVWLQNQFDQTSKSFIEIKQLAGDYVLNFGPVKQIFDQLAKKDKTAVGQLFVDFTVSNGHLDGSSVSLSDYVGKGKYVLVDFWASWCMPCRMEAPVIADVYKKYKGDKFEVVGVAVMDKRAETLRVIKEDGYSWPQIIDAQAIPLELYGIQGIPHIILFGPDGAILARDLRGEDLKSKIAEVFRK